MTHQDDSYHTQLYNQFNSQDTQSLLDIWQKGDTTEWIDEVFEIVEKILKERLGDVLPPSAPVLQRQAKKQYEAGKLEEALASSGFAVDIDPKSTAALCFRGGVYAEMGQLENAIRDYQQALLLEPDLEDAWQELQALEADLEEQFEESTAKQHLDQALEYMDNEEPERAFEEIDLARPTLPDIAAAYNYLGMIYESLDQVQLAIEAYLDAIRRNPRFSAPRTNLRNARLRLEADLYRPTAQEAVEPDASLVELDESEIPENADPDAPVLQWLYMDETDYHLTGWPGHRTRQGRSGYDPLESDFDAAHTLGVVIRRLLNRTLRTRNPYYLFMMTILGLVLCMVIAPSIVTIRVIDWLFLIILATQIPYLTVGIALLMNVYLSLWQKPTDQSEDRGSIFY